MGAYYDSAARRTRRVESTTVRAALVTVFLVLSVAAEAIAASPDCPFAGQRPPTEVLRASRLPALCEADLTGAQFGGANLTGVNLTGTALGGANLTGAILVEANLTRATLWGANLTGATLIAANLTATQFGGANLTRAMLVEANLTWAQLDGANLTEAVLSRANLTEAFLGGATLTRATLTRAILSKAWFGGSNVDGVVLDEIDTQSLDTVRGLEYATGLSRLTFSRSPSALVGIREIFAKRGLRDQEREITFAKLRTQRMLSSKNDKSLWRRIENGFSYVAFELTCAYGLYYGRPLRLLGASIVALALVYAVSTRGQGRGALWRIWAPDRVFKDEGQAAPERLTWATDRSPRAPRLGALVRALGIGLLFSLTSAFQIGWRELNVGNWISRLQPREYTLRATGWVRVVSGVQSLFSVYMVALWVLSYFGRPFE